MAEAGCGGKDTRNSSTVVSNPNKDNNNDPETMTSSRNVEVKIGVPDLGFNINESVFYSHKYFKKISVEKDGIQTSAGLCLMCQEDKNKEVLTKITDGNTKGLKMHMQSAHSNYSDQFLKSYEEVANLRNNNRKRIDSFNDGMEQTKFVKKGESNSVSVFLGDKKKLQDKFDKSVVMYAAKTYTSFSALQHLDIVVEALSSNNKPKVDVKSRVTYSRKASDMAELAQQEIMSIILSNKDTCSSFSFTTDIWTTRSMFSFVSLTVHFVTESFELVKLVPFVTYFGTKRHTGRVGNGIFIFKCKG